MSRIWITLALLAVTGTTPAQADLNLTNVRSTHGLLGPKRKDQPLAPGDLLVVRFDIEGITVDNDGKVKYSSALEVTDSNGKVFFKQAPVNSEQYLTLGGNRVPSYALLVVGLDTPTGDYRFKITVKDLASGKEQSLTRNLKVLPRDFALVRTTVALEPDSDYGAGVFVPGQRVWVRCSAVGFERDRVRMQPNVVFELRVLDESGNRTFPKPVTHTVNKDVPDDQRSLKTVFPLSLNQPGDFTFELSATDKVSGKKARTSLPLTVLAESRPKVAAPTQQIPLSCWSPVPTDPCPPVYWSVPRRPVRLGCRPWRR